MPTAQIWVGGSASVPQVDLVTISTATSSDTYVFATGTGKSVTYTAGGSDTTATIAAGLEALCAASTEPDFEEITFKYASGATFTATGPSDGAPMANSLAASTGSCSLSTTTAAKSPHDYSLAFNWLSGTAPAAGDSVTFDGTSSVPCKYGLGYADAISLTSWTRKATYPGPIGLPTTNPAGYQEFRQCWCQVDSTAITIQQAQGDGSPTIRVQGVNSSATTVTIIGMSGNGGFSASSPTGGEANDYAIEIFGLPASSIVNAVNADVGIAAYAGQACHVTTLSLSNCTGYVGAGATLVNPTVSGGSVEIDASYTTLTINNGGAVIVGGAATPATESNVVSGALQWQSTGNLNTVIIGTLGTLDMSLAPQNVTVSGGITMYAEGTLNDPLSRITENYTLTATNATWQSLNINLGVGLTLTVG